MENTDNYKGNFGSNPAGGQFDLELWMPEKFELKMVNASSLNDYEIWGLITSILCNFAVGFAVAAITYTCEYDAGNVIVPSSQFAQNLLWVITLIFVLMVFAAGWFSFKKRKKMNMKAKKINYVATIVPDNEIEETI